MRIAIGIAVLVLMLMVLGTLLEQEPAPPVPVLAEIDLPERELPSRRKFLMGFAYQPYDWSEEAFLNTFDFAQENGEFILHYLDDGAPWIEALEGRPYPANVEADLGRRLENIRPGQQVILVANALAVDREQLGGNWGAEASIDPGAPNRRPGIFKDMTFDDPEVITSFGNFCENLIDRFKPKYFFYSAEVNWAYSDPDGKTFKSFLAFSKAIYTRLKKRYPALPVSLEFIVANEEFMRERAETTRALLEYSDLFGVSSYPYVAEASPDVLGDATKIPDNWFSIIRELFPRKPIAVLETGFNAEGFSYWDRSIPGNQSSQDAYLRFLLAEAQRMDFEFVAWWVHRDYDLLWEKMSASGVDDAFAQWRDTGLLDGDGNPRRSFETWKAWQALPFDD